MLTTPGVWGVATCSMSAAIVLLAGQLVLADEPGQRVGAGAGADGGYTLAADALQPSFDGSPSIDVPIATEQAWSPPDARDAGTVGEASVGPSSVSTGPPAPLAPSAIAVSGLSGAGVQPPSVPLAVIRDHTVAAKPRSHPRVGLGADLGLSGPLPDAGLLLALRPTRWLQIQAGGGFNGFALGVRGVVTIINPFGVPVSFTCEGGHYFEGDANRVVRWFNRDVRTVASLRRFSYDYLNLLGGLEIGGRHFGFYVRGGVTWMRMTVKDFARSVHDIARVDLWSTDPQVAYRGPSFKLGTQYLF